MNLEFKEVAVKVVYYGPALSGKTTNIQALHTLFDSKHRGRLMTLETQSDRTLFFDLLPLQYKTPSGLSVKLKIYTVPGQVIHNSTRRAVLAGVDAVAFIADSQRSQALSNSISFTNLKENLKVNGINFDTLPIVVQFNKRDLDNLKPVDEIKRDWEKSRFPTFLAVATQSEGVMETFEFMIRLAFSTLDQKYDFNRKFEFDIDDLLKTISTDKMSKVEMKKAMVSSGTVEI